MSTDAPAFDCLACGTLTSTDQVDYDALGYAVCPVCGRSSGPATAPMRLPNDGERGQPTSPGVDAFEWGDAR